MSPKLDDPATRQAGGASDLSLDDGSAIARSIAHGALPAIDLVPSAGAPDAIALSVLIPTRNEAGNIAALLDRLEAALSRVSFEVLFVDDSDDETPGVIAAEAVRRRERIVLLHRPPGARGGGLGGAVVHGLREARAEWVCVMDADLQHPPEVVPRLLDQVRDRQDDLVIASRYCESGTVGSFGRTRATFSRGSTLAARAAFPDRLRGVTDPMSGFFLIRRSAIDAEALQPTGFKILLEILARSRRLRVSEVPFEFGTRHAGHSKASAREGLRYVRQLAGLRLNDDALRFLKFGLVGASGLLVNSLLLAFNAGVLGLFYLIAALLATQGSTAWNFALTERLVFLSGRRSEGRRRRCVLFFAMNNVAFGLRGPMMFVLTSALGMHYLWSNIVSMLALMILRYTTADRWIWGSAQPPLTVPAYPVVSPAVKVGEGA